MKDALGAGLKPGKGTRIDVTGMTLAKLGELFTQAAKLYEAAAGPVDFMKAITELVDGQSTTMYSRGTRNYQAANRWFAFPSDNGEMRVTFSLNNHGQFTIDFREWYRG